MPSPQSTYCVPGSVVPTGSGGGTRGPSPLLSSRDPPVGTQDQGPQTCLPLDALYAPDNLILPMTSTDDGNQTVFSIHYVPGIVLSSSSEGCSEFAPHNTSVR